MKAADIKPGLEVLLSKSRTIYRAVILEPRYQSPHRRDRKGVAVACSAIDERYQADQRSWHPDVVNARQLLGPYAELMKAHEEREALEREHALLRSQREDAANAARAALVGRVKALVGPLAFEDLELRTEWSRHINRVELSLVDLERLLTLAEAERLALATTRELEGDDV